MAKIKVRKEVYDAVYKRDHGRCIICDSQFALQLHHIMNRNYKHLINDETNCVMLCAKCHKMVHQKQDVWRSKLKEYIRRVYEDEESR